MVNLLRKYQQSLMLLVTVMVIIAFVWLYNGTRFDRLGSDQAYRVYGRPLTQADVERTARRYGVAMRMGLTDLVYGLGGGGYDQNQMLDSFVWNSYVLHHEAQELGIAPTDTEVTAAIQTLPAFQTNNAFDPIKYQMFLETQLSPYGFTDTQLEELVRDDLRLQKLRDLVGSTIEVTPAEFRSAYVQNHQKMNVSLVEFKAEDFAKAIQPTDEEIKKYYEGHKSALNSEELRTVSFVKLGLSDAQKDLKDKAKVDAQQKLADAANDFTQAMLDKKASFAEVAKQQNLEVKTTPAFTQTAPAPELISAPQVVAEAFKRTEKDPNSDPIQVENSFYILHLDKVTPSRPLTLDEARPKVVEQIKSERGHDELVAQSTKVKASIADALKAGKAFPEAVAAAGVKAEKFPAFSVSEPSDKPNAQEILQKAVELTPGAVSDLVQVETGGLLVHLDNVEPIDEAKFKKDEETQMAGLRRGKRYSAFRQWMLLQRKAADVQSLVEQRGGRRK